MFTSAQLSKLMPHIEAKEFVSTGDDNLDKIVVAMKMFHLIKALVGQTWYDALRKHFPHILIQDGRLNLRLSKDGSVQDRKDVELILKCNLNMLRNYGLTINIKYDDGRICTYEWRGLFEIVCVGRAPKAFHSMYSALEDMFSESKMAGVEL